MDVSLALLWYVAFLFSAVLHEAAHAWASWRLGDSTAYAGGQVTLDPLPHIKREPLGMVAVPILFFFSTGWMCGWASAPFNAFWAQQYPKRAGLMAIAGPAANLLIALIAGVLIRGGIAAGWFDAPSTIAFPHCAQVAGTGLSASILTFLNILFMLNLILFIFNLLPVPPFDGGAAVCLFLDDVNGRSYQRLIWSPAGTVVGLVIACAAFPWVFEHLFPLALGTVYPGLSCGRAG